ncbi:LamG-like jellyroll fold domain-containing protein [Streptomyces sp. RKAG290]|uniref:LamG-like jellyroll fold domain-containing protein n=1 Tax=Streptomyces sp. RKAG290 TaxID=2888348 RepID=UPI002033993C|nr:LamG-like jellyroll fold domain-containing protein [Streptomyces sp. RKAG290]MCM2416371.1 DUF4981 domain-containing protein [Streptomyces sp. RKAG290]
MDSWVEPASWTGDFTIASKGDHSYALRMKDENTLEFTVQGDDAEQHSASVTVPDDWYGSWHRASGTFDGSSVKLLIDGRQVAATAFKGTVAYSAQPVNIGRNSETGTEGMSTRMAHGVIDQVRVYHQALTAKQLEPDPASDAVLALDFEKLRTEGTYQSYGSGMGGVDGLVSTERTLQPETRALAAVHAPIRISGPKAGSGKVTVLNERSFTGTGDLRLTWKITEGAKALAQGSRPLAIDPGRSAEVQLPEPPANPKDADRQLTVRAVQAASTAWAPPGTPSRWNSSISAASNSPVW